MHGSAASEERAHAGRCGLAERSPRRGALASASRSARPSVGGGAQHFRDRRDRWTARGGRPARRPSPDRRRCGRCGRGGARRCVGCGRGRQPPGCASGGVATCRWRPARSPGDRGCRVESGRGPAGSRRRGGVGDHCAQLRPRARSHVGPDARRRRACASRAGRPRSTSHSTTPSSPWSPRRAIASAALRRGVSVATRSARPVPRSTKQPIGPVTRLRPQRPPMSRSVKRMHSCSVPVARRPTPPRRNGDWSPSSTPPNARWSNSTLSVRNAASTTRRSAPNKPRCSTNVPVMRR